MFLLALDAGKKTLASDRYRIRSVDMWTTPADISTVVDAPRVAAREYHDLFWEDMRTDLERDGLDLKISTCDADLLVLAAHQLVHDQMNGETERRLEKLGISVRRVDE